MNSEEPKQELKVEEQMSTKEPMSQQGGKHEKKSVGSRAEVFHGNADHTSGGLKKSQLIKNKNGRIVSKKKSISAKKEQRLKKHGYFTVKGKFGFVKKDSKKKSRKSRK
jgi:hypothetical protein